MDFLIGGIAGAGATIVSNPMDVVKVRLQLQGELRARGSHVPQYKNILHAMYTIGKVDGLAALQSGLGPAMALGFAMNAVRLGIYRSAERRGWTLNENGHVNIFKAIVWAGFSGGFSGGLANPAYVVKTRMQSASHPSIAVGRQHSYDGSWDAISQIYKKDGLRGFGAGINATICRTTVGGCAQLTSFSTLKEYFERRRYFEGWPVERAFYASFINTFVVVAIETPLDVINTRLYYQGSDHSTKLYKGVFDCFVKIYKTEGLHGLYKGFGPLLFRLAPHTTVSLVIWDSLNRFVKENYG